MYDFLPFVVNTWFIDLGYWAAFSLQLTPVIYWEAPRLFVFWRTGPGKDCVFVLKYQFYRYQMPWDLVKNIPFLSPQTWLKFVPGSPYDKCWNTVLNCSHWLGSQVINMYCECVMTHFVEISIWYVACDTHKCEAIVCWNVYDLHFFSQLSCQETRWWP